MVLGYDAQSLVQVHTPLSFHLCVLKKPCPLESSHWSPSCALRVTLRLKSAEDL